MRHSLECSLGTGQAGPAIAPPRFLDDDCACGRGHGRRPVCGTAIDHEHAAQAEGAETVDQRADRVALVDHGDDRRHGPLFDRACDGIDRRLKYRLQIRPTTDRDRLVRHGIRALVTDAARRSIEVTRGESPPR